MSETKACESSVNQDVCICYRDTGRLTIELLSWLYILHFFEQLLTCPECAPPAPPRTSAPVSRRSIREPSLPAAGPGSPAGHKIYIIYIYYIYILYIYKIYIYKIYIYKYILGHLPGIKYQTLGFFKGTLCPPETSAWCSSSACEEPEQGCLAEVQRPEWGSWTTRREGLRWCGRTPAPSPSRSGPWRLLRCCN